MNRYAVVLVLYALAFVVVVGTFSLRLLATLRKRFSRRETLTVRFPVEHTEATMGYLKKYLPGKAPT